MKPTFRPAPRRAASCLLSLALLLAPGTLAAQLSIPAADVAALSVREAIELAREHNPALQQQRNTIDVARSSVRSAYGGLMPSASASSTLDYTAAGERRFGSVELQSQPDYYGSSYNLSLGYQLSGSTLLQPTVERAQERATERRFQGADAGLVSQVTQQYLTVLQAREQVAQAEREVGRTQEHVRLAQARLEVGSGTPLDVRRAEVQQGRAEVGLVQARSASASQLLVLGQLIGVRLQPHVRLESTFEIFRPTWSADELIGAALAANPGLLAARSGEEAARTSVRAAQSSFLPTVNLNVGMRGSVYQAGDIDPLVREQMTRMQGSFAQCVSQNDIRSRVGLPLLPCVDPGATPGFEAELREQIRASNSGYPFDFARQPLSASMTLSLPIFSGFSRQLQVDRARAAASNARHEVRAQELRLYQEVGSALLNLDAAHSAAELQDRVRLNAEEELRLAQERFRFGAASSLEVTDAQTNLAQAERDRIDAVYDFHKALAALEALIGQPLR